MPTSEKAALPAVVDQDDDGSDNASPRRHNRADRADFAKRLGQLVHGRGVRQADLARKSGLTPALISSYILGKAVPGRVNLIKIANALNVPPDAILPEAADDADAYADRSPMSLIVSRSDPSMATLRVNMQVKTALGSEIIQLLLKERDQV